MYPVVFFDALRVKIRNEDSVKNKAVYLTLGIQRDGTKDALLSVRLLPGTHILKADFAKLNGDRLYLNMDRLLVGRQKLNSA
jgi:transposase-like protein